MGLKLPCPIKYKPWKAPGSQYTASICFNEASIHIDDCLDYNVDSLDYY